MKTKITPACILGILLLVGCASSTQNEPQHAETDTMPIQKTTPAPALGPGSAHVSATVVGYRAEQNAYICTLKIKQVHRYGASTPPLPVGVEIAVLMGKRLFGDDPDGAKAAERLQTGRDMDVTLKHQQVPDESAAPRWRALELQ